MTTLHKQGYHIHTLVQNYSVSLMTRIFNPFQEKSFCNLGLCFKFFLANRPF